MNGPVRVSIRGGVFWAWALLLACASCSERRPAISESKALSVPLHEGDLAILDVSFPSGRVLRHQSVVAEISLANATSRNLWVNGRMLVNREDDPPEVREVWIMLQGPNGKDIPLECYKRTRLVDHSDYKVIKPHETTRKKEVLNDCYSIEALGIYKLAAFYKDGNPKPPSPPPGATYLSQMLQSVPVSFEVVGSL